MTVRVLMRKQPHLVPRMMFAGLLWLQAAAAMGAPAAPPEAALGTPHPDAPPEARQFDFLVGQHDCSEEVFDAGTSAWRSGAKTWDGAHVLDGWGIQDGGASPWRGFSATNLRFWDPKERRWKVSWFGTPPYRNGVWEGGKVGEEMVVEQTTPAGISRLTFYDISAEGFAWKSELVPADGVPRLHWKITCHKRTAPRRVAAEPDMTIDPRGVFFHAWTGSTAGTEWALLLPADGERRYAFADTRSKGVIVTIDLDGRWTVEASEHDSAGGGIFVDKDRALIDWRAWGMRFNGTLQRAAFTSPDFPLVLESPEAGNPLLAGAWQSRSQQIGPLSGAVIEEREETVTVRVEGETLRLTDAAGRFYQGVFETPSLVGFRVIDNPPRSPLFRTFPGSATNREQDLLGMARILDINLMEVNLLLQTRYPVSDAVQTQLRFVLSRDDPFPAGDVDGP